MRNQYKYEAHMFKKKQRIEQGSLWVATHELSAPKTLPFYRALDAILSEMDFGNKVRKWSAPYYQQDGPGYPGVDPEVYFKMLMVGIFEGIASERGIDARCADSLGIRTFLGYGITEETPCYATLGNIRRRLGEEVFAQVFALLQKKLAEEDLLTGTHLGIDTSVIEANASLRELRHKTSGKKYRAYVKDLAKEDGVDTTDEHAVNRYDRKRKGKKLSNDEWEHPHDPDARIGRDKKGATRMLYKVEHVVDLDTNALIGVRILPGEEGDAEHPTDHVLDAEMRAAEMIDPEEMDLPVETVTGDRGYHSKREVHKMYAEYGIMPNIPDPILNRNMGKLSEEERASLETAARYTKSAEGKQLQKKRAEFVERSFAHTLESGGMRRSTLRGTESISKRYQIAGFCVNLSLLMRKRFGFGTAKQCAATSTCAVFTALDALILTWISVILHFKTKLRSKSDFSHHDACNNITVVLCPRVIFTQ
jgi:transposase